jgi:hypothetical protein
MAEQDKNSSGTTGTAAAADTTAKIRLARNHKISRAKTIEEGGGFETPFHDPPTHSGEVNIFGFGAIFLPSLTEQKSGFTPLRVAKKEVVKTSSGVEVHFWFDKDSGQEATRILLEQFPGIYKMTAPTAAKGE